MRMMLFINGYKSPNLRKLGGSMSKKNFGDYYLTVKDITFSINHGYSGITLVYILKGSTNISIDGQSIALKESQVMVINKNRAYKLVSEERNVTLILNISANYLSRYYKNYFYYIINLTPEQSTGAKDGRIDTVKLLLATIGLSYVKGSYEYSPLEVNILVSELLLVLLADFKEKELSAKYINSSYSKRVNKAISVIKANYKKVLSLKDVADEVHFSISYLSRLFKKEVGMNFIDYLTNIRFEHCVSELINTSKPLSQIIQTSGFSSGRRFTELFKSVYHVTPGQFRRSYKGTSQPIFIADSINNENEADDIIGPVNIAEVISLLNYAINYYSGK